MAARDFEILADLGPAWASAAHNARAREYWDMDVKARHAAAIDTVEEAVGRYEALVLGLMPATLEYRPDMTDAQLRAWAADLVEVLNR